MITAILIICLVSLTPFPSLPLVIYYYSKFGFLDGFIVLIVASNLKIIIHYKIGGLLRRKKINFFNLQDKISRAKRKYKRIMVGIFTNQIKLSEFYDTKSNRAGSYKILTNYF